MRHNGTACACDEKGPQGAMDFRVLQKAWGADGTRRFWLGIRDRHTPVGLDQLDGGLAKKGGPSPALAGRKREMTTCRLRFFCPVAWAWCGSRNPMSGLEAANTDICKLATKLVVLSSPRCPRQKLRGGRTDSSSGTCDQRGQARIEEEKMRTTDPENLSGLAHPSPCAGSP